MKFMVHRRLEVQDSQASVAQIKYVTSHSGGHAVAQFVETLRYKMEGCGFDSRWCHWYFSLT
jgi:hypothetical protein